MSDRRIICARIRGKRFFSQKRRQRKKKERKMFKLFLLAAVCAVALAGAPKFTVCSGKEAALQDVEITTDTANWVAGSTVHFTVKGQLYHPIPSGTIKTVATFAGSEVANKEDNLCTYEGTPFQCPIATGAQSWTFTFPIPAVPFHAALVSTSHFAYPGGEFFCMEVNVGL